MSEPRYGLHDFNTIPGLPTNNGRPPDSWQPVYLSGIEDTETQPPSLGHNLIYPGLRHIFSGPPESAKTLVAYSAGIDILNHHPNEHILLMDFEMGPKAAKRRWRYAGATDHQLDNNILYLAPDQPAQLERIEILVALNPILVIIDAAAGAFDNEDLDDNKRADAERWRKTYVDPFFDAGIATIVIDHVVKNTESRGKYVIGSERKIGGGEVHIGFDTIKPVKRGSTGIYKMLLHRDREGHFERGHFCDVHVTSHPETHNLTCEFKPTEHSEDGTKQLPTELMQRVSHYLEAQDEPVTRNQIVLNVKGNAEFVRRSIDHLVDLKFVEESSGSNRARLYQTTRPFIRSEWESKQESQVRPSSSPVRPDELVSGSSSSSPPTGDGRTTTLANKPKFVQTDDDPEVQAMLAHYNLLEPTELEPPGDLHDPDTIPGLGDPT
jgi:hypothetical protein